MSLTTRYNKLILFHYITTRYNKSKEYVYCFTAMIQLEYNIDYSLTSNQYRIQCNPINNGEKICKAVECKTLIEKKNKTKTKQTSLTMKQVHQVLVQWKHTENNSKHI